jgi:adenine deaminase
MGTINTAAYFGLLIEVQLSSRKPPRRFDRFLFSDLKKPIAEQVYRGGHLVARDGR